MPRDIPKKALPLRRFFDNEYKYGSKIIITPMDFSQVKVCGKFIKKFLNGNLSHPPAIRKTGAKTGF